MDTWPGKDGWIKSILFGCQIFVYRYLYRKLYRRRLKCFPHNLEIVSTCDNLNEVMAQMPKSTYYDRINSCRQLGINPVTITAETGINHLDNPLPSVLRGCDPRETVWAPRIR